MKRILSIIVLFLLIASCSKENISDHKLTSKIRVNADGFYLSNEFKPKHSDLKLKLGQMNEFDLNIGDEVYLYYASFSEFGGSINFGDTYEENGNPEEYTLTLDGKSYNYVFGDVLKLKNKGVNDWNVNLFIKRGDPKN